MVNWCTASLKMAASYTNTSGYIPAQVGEQYQHVFFPFQTIKAMLLSFTNVLL
jgi:uncharacterized membrane protein YobD (UPF0266 family)